MKVTKHVTAPLNGFPSWEIILEPVDAQEERLLTIWREYRDKHQGILHTFYDEMDPIMDRLMGGRRGEVWDYVPESMKEDKWPVGFETFVYS